MTSREIADLVESRHDSVKRSIERLAETGAIQLPPLVDVKNEQGQTVAEYHIGKRDTYVIVAQLSPQFTARLVDRWQELERAAAPRALTPAEMFLQNAQAMVAIERRQAEQDKAVALISQRVEQVAQTQLLTARPAASESITYMRPRAAKLFGLPERVVEHVIRQSPIAPRPAGMVKNDRAEAEGSSYAVYWIKDVNDVLRRFVAECEMVTACMATHPYVDGRFKLVKAGAE